MPRPASRPDTAAGERLHRLLGGGSPVGGWVPDQPHLRDPMALDPLPPAEPVSVAGVLRSARVDPGRRGVAALAVVAVVGAALTAVVLLRGRTAEQPLVPPTAVGPSASPGAALLVVDVAGRVRRPGLVRLPAGARVDDAIRAAGGVVPGASTGSLNLARKVADGEQVLVGVAAGGPSGPAGSQVGAGGLLDLNLATAQDLDGLPGIGPVLAERIVAWRTEHGRFASVDQLREVDGIGEAKFGTLRTKVTV